MMAPLGLSGFGISGFCSLKLKIIAQMVKLVDTLVSGTSERKLVQVRVLFWALKTKIIKRNNLKYKLLRFLLLDIFPAFSPQNQILHT